MADGELRHRISRLVEREVKDYLGVENEYLPYLHVSRTDTTDVMQFVYPPHVDLPVFEITVKEKRHGGN